MPTNGDNANYQERRLITEFDSVTGTITFAPAVTTATPNGAGVILVPADMLNPAGEALIAAAVRDVSNAAPAAGSLGAEIKSGGVAPTNDRFTT